MVHEPLSEAKAVSEINRAAARHGGEHEAAVEGRTRWTAFKARRSAAVEERERELADGHVPIAYTGFVTITVSEADELRRASRTIQRRCQRHRVSDTTAVGSNGARPRRRLADRTRAVP